MNFNKEEFGGIVFVTESPDDLCPNNSTYAQSLLGLDENISAIDVVHACPGYIYGLWNSALIANNMNKKVLLLVAETNSYFVSPYDKVTGPLFGDAGTATVISPSETEEEWKFAFFTDSSKRNALIIPGFGFRQKPSEEKIKYKEYPDGSKRRDHDMYMNGEAVFRYVTQTASKYIKSFMKEVNKTSENYDYAIFHQANAFMLKMLARSLNFSIEKVPLSLDKFGNTNSASIPLNIVSELSNIIIGKKSKILMSGFGAGLATGIADLEIGPCYCTEVINYE